MNRVALQVVDLGFGDSGKGTVVDYLVRRGDADLIVRFNGGPQAGHNVVLPDGRHHTFAQFGSGSFVPGVKTLLSRYMLIEPYAMLKEAAHLETIGVADVMGRTHIDERCLVITPIHQIINRLRERARGPSAHGTCGMGVGECVADSIERPEMSLHAADLRGGDQTLRKLRGLLDLKRWLAEPWRSIATPDELRVLEDSGWINVTLDACDEIARHTTILSAPQANRILREARHCIFEGAQGVLLDEQFGFHPHTTWSTTTFANADRLLDEAQSDARRQHLGVIRTYMTRHGPGPFVTERPTLREPLPEAHNPDHGSQGSFRRGVLDLVMLRYAVSACGGVDALAVTHVDRLPQLPPVLCDQYELDGRTIETLSLPKHTDETRIESLAQTLRRAVPHYRAVATGKEAGFLSDLQASLQTPILHRSRGPTFVDKELADV